MCASVKKKTQHACNFNKNNFLFHSIMSAFSRLGQASSISYFVTIPLQTAINEIKNVLYNRLSEVFSLFICEYTKTADFNNKECK